MTKCIEKFADFSEKFDMLPRGAKILAAVSGGADSVCLLYMLTELSEKLGITVCCAHFNHSLRSEESDRDELFTKNLSSDLNIPFLSERGDVPGFAKENGLGTEEAARRLRYEFLERARQKFGADKIATAHNRDDNAETVILNLSRGAGSAGVSGIPPVRGNIIRPLLCLSRDEIEEYLASKNASFVTDSSNLTDDYARNKIRHNVMPVLREINSQASAHFLNASLSLREDNEYLYSEAQKFINENFTASGIDASKIAQLPQPIASRVIRLMAGTNITSAQTEAVLSLIKSGTRSAHLDLTGTSADLSQGMLTFGKNAQTFDEFELICGKTVTVPAAGISICLNKTVFDDNIHKSFTDYLFKTSAVYGRIIVRPRKSGDDIRLRGKSFTKSLKKLYNEEHIPAYRRASVPVICDDNGILAVYGIGCSDRGTPKNGDDIYRITIKEIDSND